VGEFLPVPAYPGSPGSTAVRLLYVLSETHWISIDCRMAGVAAAEDHSGHAE